MTPAELIADRLTNGMEHPGDIQSGGDQPPAVIVLPFFKPRPGIPAEMSEKLYGLSTKMIGEALIHEMEKAGYRVTRDQLSEEPK